jgi:esterase/lipase
MARGILGMMHYDATKTLGLISVPTLVVAGNQDSITKPEASELINSGIRSARLINYTGPG